MPRKRFVNTETIETEEKEKLDLAVEVKETSACERHVTVTVPRSDIEKYFDKQFDELVPRAEVPGFRVGKAPRQLVEKKFRKQLTGQVKGSILMDSLSQVSDSQDFSAISEPDLDFEQVVIPEEGDLTYEFNIEVRPEFDLPEWKGLSLERPEREFTD
ncbi:MAG: trigger factor family protein, partial [Planctomycetaceae bacterium]|nr:trigger factor family protein [Planctomycetaceae bacterium]